MSIKVIFPFEFKRFSDRQLDHRKFEYNQYSRLGLIHVLEYVEEQGVDLLRYEEDFADRILKCDFPLSEKDITMVHEIEKLNLP